MTRIKSAAAILAIILALSVFSLCFIKSETAKMIKMTEQLQTLTENGETQMAVEKTDEILLCWEVTFRKLSPLVRNDRLSAVRSSLVRIKPLIISDSDEVYAEIESIQSLLFMISENETPYLHNIF
ncbi:MAG TPA: hypothetical protein DIW26_03115 [Ruminococcus sp.]|nr:hypothetical protein [Ruminococcus sp.]HCR73404.1 hypothetical protein [Ruminococcus sp.]